MGFHAQGAHAINLSPGSFARAAGVANSAGTSNNVTRQLTAGVKIK